ncbi:expressed unknown protein [Ectocarpus siliculosus]|uniref:Bacteriophage T5 Orf172 DNA-binding domain-containing protein n=1 Tax=Ectocarpus siliculosus TaxID=2880 RepID=D7FT97_ECTSI|nr:expressed unknown protein [Ectocarpus siliculosus]|eukprot:CBJ31363.1 expressed unknown protein [Ectocarpus siliculosus]
MGAVDETWTKKELQAECKRRGITGYSRLNKASLLRALQTGVVMTPSATGGGGGGGSSSSTNTQSKGPADLTVAELREECRRRGLQNVSKLKKDELIRLLKDNKKPSSSSGNTPGEAKPREATLEELRAECRKRGMTGYSHLKKQELIRRMADYKSSDNGSKGVKASPSVARGGKATRIRFLGRGGKEKQQQRARMKGPLRSRAQERFDAGPSPQDTPGFLYIYCESGGGGGGGGDKTKEWKIGKTTLDPPERRMKQSAHNNRKAYTLRASWHVPWCGYVEKIVHLDLDDLKVVPGKEKSWDGGGREDGGTEWFRADIDVVEARVKLAIRMVAAREADEADFLGVQPAFCGMFRCGLPVRRRRRLEPKLGAI